MTATVGTVAQWLALGVLAVALASPARPALVIAHRGASWYAPEHTFAAWDLALEMGADYLEQDLQMTADGILVVLHDEELDRTASSTDSGPTDVCRGPVVTRTLAQLRSCEVGSWFNRRYPDRARPEYPDLRIPTLDEVLHRYAGRARFYIETKNPETAPGMEQALVDVLVAHGLLPRGGSDMPPVIVQSFSFASLQALHALAPDLPLVLLVGNGEAAAGLVDRLPEIAEIAAGIGPSRTLVDASLVDRAHALGLIVHPYTVDDPGEMDRLLAAGVDGMFTNRPDVLRRLVPQP